MDRQTSPFALTGLHSRLKMLILSPLVRKLDSSQVPPLTLQKVGNLPEVTWLAWWQSGAWVTPSCHATSDELPNSFSGTEMSELPSVSTNPTSPYVLILLPRLPLCSPCLLRLGWSPPDHLLTLSGVTCPWYLELSTSSRLFSPLLLDF